MNDRRRHILELFRVQGNLSVGDLARKLHVTHASASSHIARLLADGLVKRSGLRAGKRRPSVVFSLTEAADSQFHQEYEAVAVTLVEELRRSGRGNLNRMLRRVADSWTTRDRVKVGALRGQPRVDQAMRILTEHGLMPALERTGRRFTLQQRQCPILRLCRSDHDGPELMRHWIAGLFGMPVRRQQCIRDGNPACTYAIGAPRT